MVVGNHPDFYQWKILIFLTLLIIACFCPIKETNARLLNRINSHGSILQVQLLPLDVRQTSSEADASQIKCQDEDGNYVDWFVAYKIAKLPKSLNVNVRQGLGYSFILPGGSQEWTLSTKNINQSQSIVGRTIGSIFDNENGGSDLLYLAYNDQPPRAPAIDDNGHTKGVLMANQNGGIWLQHSVPHFPDIVHSSPQNKYSYPTTGVHNGQIFFCMTLSARQLDETVGNILQITKPHVFAYQFPTDLKNIYSNLRLILPKIKSNNIIKEKVRFSLSKKLATTTTTATNNIFNLPVGQLNLTVFAKGPNYNTEIYADWIAPNLNTNLKVQSWLNGPHPMPSNCTSKTLSVLNILSKKVDGNEFTTHSDHSKWALGGDREWACIADLNRMDHQKVRGGVGICVQNEKLWTAFKSIVLTTQPCI